MEGRLRKLGFKLAHLLREEGGGGHLPEKLMNMFVGIVWTGGADFSANGVPTVRSALEDVDRGLARETAAAARDKQKRFRSLFQEFVQESWGATANVMKPPTESPGFTADSMTEDWSKIWYIESVEEDEKHATSWKSYAEKAKDSIPRSPMTEDWLPSYEEFLDKAQGATGGAGFDGWSSAEIKLLARQFPWLIYELYSLWVDTADALVTTGIPIVPIWMEKEIQVSSPFFALSSPASAPPILAHAMLAHAVLLAIPPS